MGRDAIIGHTGFVGGSLKGQHNFTGQFNSSNISHIGKDSFETVVCAAAPGSMFTANKDPQRDLDQINELISSLQQVRANRIVLISSIAVLRDFASGADETTTEFQTELSYGRHRRLLEAFVEDHFDDSLIVRLPALFGKGLRKNFIFDLLNPTPTMIHKAKLESLSLNLDGPLFEHLLGFYAHDPVTGMMKLDRAALNRDPNRADIDNAALRHNFSATQFHNPDTSYQYYNMTRLWADIELARKAGLGHIHLAPAPLKAADIHRRLTGREMPQTEARLHHEDMRTQHASLWGRHGPYISESDTVMDELEAFFNSQR